VQQALLFLASRAIMVSMRHARPILNCAVAAFLTLTSPFPALAQGIDVNNLLSQLADPQVERPARLERQILREWARSGSATVDFLFERGQAALQAGRAVEAIDHFSAVIDHAPAFAEAWNGRATAFFLANRLGQSLADIEEVLIRNPSHFGALAGLGMIMEQLEQPERARRAYQASAAINPHQPNVNAALARLDLALQGQSL